MKSARPVFRVSRNNALPYISSFVLGIVLLALTPSQAIAQCDGYKIDIPNVCDCDDPVEPAKGLPVDDRMFVTVKITAAPGQTWTIKNVHSLYSTASPPAPADPTLLSVGTMFTDAGGGMYTLNAIRLKTSGFWVQATNGTCDLDIMVGDPCTTIGLLIVTLPDGSTLYVHPTDNSPAIQWGGKGTNIPGLPNLTNAATAKADFNGATNTQAIVDALGAGNYAARLCADLVAYGCDDWYLPALGELKAMHQQLGQNGSKDIPPLGFFWSSSEVGSPNAWELKSINQGVGGRQKASDHRCRCVRR